MLLVEKLKYVSSMSQFFWYHYYFNKCKLYNSIAKEPMEQIISLLGGFVNFDLNPCQSRNGIAHIMI